MFFCEKCGGRRFASRTLFLLHVSECEGLNSAVVEENIILPDKTQADCTWSLMDDVAEGQEIQSLNVSLESGEGVSRGSSPLTYEQLKVSQDVEKLLHGLSYNPNECIENWLPENNVISAPADATDTQIQTTDFQAHSVEGNNYQGLSNEIQPENFLKNYKTYLQSIKLKIDSWRYEKRKATNLRNFNKSRRITKNIKKHERILAEIESGNLENLHTMSKNLLPTATVTSCNPAESEPKINPVTEAICSNTKKRKNYCTYCQILVSNFSRHIERKHGSTPEGIQLCAVTGETAKEKEKNKKNVTNIIIKKWNDEYNQKLIAHSSENLAFIPVKRTLAKEINLKVDYVKCAHCLGLYVRKKLSSHLKICPVYKTKIQEEKERNEYNIKKLKAISKHSVPLVPHIEGMTNKFLKDILSNIKNDEIGKVVKNDPLILLFGVVFLKSRMHSSELSYVRREMRTLATLLINIKQIDPTIADLESCISVAHFKTLVKAVETWSKLDEKTGTMSTASVPYRILTPLNECVEILRQKRLEIYYNNASNDRKDVKEVEDFETLVKRRWSSLLGRTATKSLKSSKTLKTGKMAIEDDIYAICSYITDNYKKLMLQLSKKPNRVEVYDMLLDMLLAHIMCLCRRRPVDLTRATLKHYQHLDDTDDLIKQAHLKPGELLTEEDIRNCKFFKTFYVPGKNYDKVPVVLTPQMKDVLDLLIKVRSSVQITSTTLLIKSKNRPVEAGRSLEKVKENVKLKKPNQLTALGLRHHAATFSKLHSTNPHYQDFLASAMGHTLFMHKTKYDLPLSVLHKVFVAPTLHSMTTGERSVQQAGSSSSIPIINPLKQVPASTSTCTSDAIAREFVKERDSPSTNSGKSDDDDDHCSEDDQVNKKCKRKKWSTPEKYPIYKAFADSLLSKKPIPRKKIIDIYEDNLPIYKDRTEKQIVSFTNNLALRKVKNVTPELKKFKKVDNITESDEDSSS